MQLSNDLIYLTLDTLIIGQHFFLIHEINMNHLLNWITFWSYFYGAFEHNFYKKEEFTFMEEIFIFFYFLFFILLNFF